jgi:twitching motility protein PilT
MPDTQQMSPGSGGEGLRSGTQLGRQTVPLPKATTELLYSLVDLLAAARDCKASDIHLQIGDPPIVRVNGVITRFDGPPLTEKSMDELLHSLLPEERKVLFQAEGSVDYAIELTGIGRFRVNIFKEQQGPSAVLRLLPSKIKNLHELNLPPGIEANLLTKSNGLVLVVGPTGSGKSTTLAAMVDHLNSTRNDINIVTLEAPIEFVHHSKYGVVRQREVGIHVPSFERGVRDAMRQNPDVILVGEIRDRETMQAALQAAETGHLVFGTLHTTGAAKTIDRVLGFFEAGDKENIKTQLSTVLRGVVSQVLIPRVDSYDTEKEPGRAAAFEVMITNAAISNLLREMKLSQINDSIQGGAKEGMISLDNQLIDLFKRGVISLESVLQKCLSERKHMEDRLTQVLRR